MKETKNRKPPQGGSGTAPPRLDKVLDESEVDEIRQERAELAGAEARSTHNRYDRFAVDKNRLDEQWFALPRQFAEAADRLAATRYDYDRAKAERDLIWAETEMAVRKEPDKYGLTKDTEPAIKNTTSLQPAVRAAEEKVLRLKHAVDVCQVDVDALDVKKKTLENGVKLFLADYFSKPMEPREPSIQKGFQDHQFDKAFKKGQK